jgi:hypothetical protein
LQLQDIYLIHTMINHKLDMFLRVEEYVSHGVQWSITWISICRFYGRWRNIQKLPYHFPHERTPSSRVSISPLYMIMMSYRRGRIFLKWGGGRWCNPRYRHHHLTSKVTFFLCVSPIHPLVNGIPLHTPSFHNNRFTLSCMEATEEATSTQGLKPDKVHTWKTRRKELLRSSSRSYLRSNQAPDSGLVQTGP